MKGLILSGGYGTRIRPLTYSQQKQLIPVANKPILFYGIEDIIEAGVEEIGIITGPNREQVIKSVKSIDWNAKIEFIHQGEPKGIAHAVKVARYFLGEEPFVVYLGDNILREGIIRHAKEFIENGYDGSVMLAETKNPQRFGVAELNEDGSIKRLVEKPKVPPSNLALVGIYFFKPIVHKAISHLKPSWRNELEITEAIQWLISNNYRVGWTKVTGWWKDTGKAEDILEANRLVLEDLERNIRINTSAKIVGGVAIDKGTDIDESTTVNGPVVIGRGCRIKNAYIGPYTSIGDGCVIENTEIEDSVVMERSMIFCGERIIDSLIGREVKIRRKGKLPNAKRLIVGDNSEVYL